MTPIDVHRGAALYAELLTLARDYGGERPWHHNLQRKHKLHHVVVQAIRNGYPMAAPFTLLGIAKEWPHVSVQDPQRLAYTRNHEQGELGRTTMTTVGKYVKQRWPGVKDHELRDATAVEFADGCRIVRTTQEIVDSVQKGPRSCMRWVGDMADRLYYTNNHHPYECYAPEFGWASAIRLEGESIEARALVLHKVDGSPLCYVRSYKRPEFDHQASPSDTILEAWLMQQGYQKFGGWPVGTKLKAIEARTGDNGLPMLCVPYIDGGVQYAKQIDDHTLALCSVDGEFSCTSQHGRVQSRQPYRCQCGRRSQYALHRLFVSPEEIVQRCSNCVGPDVVRANWIGTEVHVNVARTIAIGGYRFVNHEMNFAHYRIVLCHDRILRKARDCERMDDGLYYPRGELYYSEVTDRYYLRKDVVETADGVVAPLDHTWVCAASGLRYSTLETPVVIGERRFHKDHGMAIFEATAARNEARAAMEQALATTHHTEPAREREENTDDLPF